MQNRASIVVVVIACALAGCGKSSEHAEREKERLLLEQQAQRAIQKSNQAVNEVTKKLGRKPPTLDLGLPAEKKAEPAPAPEPTRKP
jgi:hypothetical protein